MKRTFALTLVVCIAAYFAVWASTAAAESEEAGVELQSYFSNANTTGGGALVQVTAPLEGNETISTPNLQRGETCAMIYVFDKFQRMVS
jgi:hypothetical protein